MVVCGCGCGCGGGCGTADVAPYNSSFLNDIVVDEVNGYAYISDTGAVGGIIVYDYNSNTARRWGGDPTQQADATFSFTINNATYKLGTNEDGIALTPDLQTLFYCPLNGNHQYSIPTALLRNFSTTDDFLHSQVWHSCHCGPIVCVRVCLCVSGRGEFGGLQVLVPVAGTVAVIIVTAPFVCCGLLTICHWVFALTGFPSHCVCS